MSIAGDTQTRVPGFYSRPETILSMRKGGIFLSIADNPNYFTALQSQSNPRNVNIGGTFPTTSTSTVGGNIAIVGGIGNSGAAQNLVIGDLSNNNGIANNNVVGCNLTCAAGQSNSIFGDGSSTVGNINYTTTIGYQCQTTTSYSTTLGNLARVDTAGEISFANGDGGTRGDSRYSIIICRRTTTNATPTELGTSDGVSSDPTNRLICTNNTTYIYDVDFVVRNTADTANCAAYNIKFAFNRGANAASSTISSISKTIIYTLGTTTGWDVNATADTSNGRPNIQVTGAASTTLKWVATVKMTKVSN